MQWKCRQTNVVFMHKATEKIKTAKGMKQQDTSKKNKNFRWNENNRKICKRPWSNFWCGEFFYLVPDSYRIKIKKKIKQKKIFWCWQKLPSFHKKESSFSLFIVPDIWKHKQTKKNNIILFYSTSRPRAQKKTREK